MAEVLDEFDFPRTGGNRIYPWEEWLDGRIWCLRKGEDFEISAASFRRYTWKVSVERDLQVRTSIQDDGHAVIIRASPR